MAEMRTEYGGSLSPGFRFGRDSDGLTDRSAGADFAIHLNPAHVLRAGYQYRWLEQNRDVRRLVRYDLGWSGTVSRKLALYTTVSSVDYRQAGVDKKFVGDASVALGVADSFRLNGGVGSIAMDAFNAIGNQVTSPFAFGEGMLSFGPNTRLRSRYSYYSFSDDVVRNRLDAELTRALVTESRVRLSAGWRSNLMWHNAQTDDFYSPRRLISQLGFAQATGRIASWLEYGGEIAAGWQSERNSQVLHPFQATGRLYWQPSRHLRTVIEAAKSTSSLDRSEPGQRIYSRWVASAGVEVRFP
jgi:hypothetical protein